MNKKYRIGELAKRKDIDPQTLRYYDKLGILSPSIVDEETGYRYYTIDQFLEVDRIKFYKMLGLSLEDIKKCKDVKDVNEALQTLILQKKQF